MSGPILIIGGHGFVGRRLARVLRAEGADVVIVSRAHGGDGFRADVTDLEAIERVVRAVGPQVMVNLAVDRSGNRRRMHAVNAIGAHNVLHAAVSCGVARLVHAASLSEVGGTSEPISDESPLAPVAEYGETKAAGTRAVIEPGHGDLEVVVVRASYIYGEDEAPQRLIPTAWRAAMSGEPMQLTNGDISRDWLHVDDAARAMALMTRAPLPAARSTVTAASHISTANREVLRLVEAATGRSIRIAANPMPPRPWDVASQHVMPSTTLRDLGWKPEVQLADGVARYGAR